MSNFTFFAATMAAAAFLGGTTAYAGTVTGKVLDESGTPIANIAVEGEGFRAVTGGNGRFRVSSLAGGEYVLTFSGVGYAAEQHEVSVPDTGDTSLDVTLGRILDEVVVTASRLARLDSLRAKRNAANIRDVLTANDIGQLPDRNLAEAVSRIVGVSMLDNKGEGRFVSIRGVAPGLNELTVGGAPVAFPDVDGRAGRAVPLDVIGAGQYAQIEVMKTKTPAMSAQGIGGTINVIPFSALERGERFGYASLEGGYNTLEPDSDIYGLDAGFGNIFADGKVGLYVGASYHKRELFTENASGSDWGTFDAFGGVGALEELRVSTFDVERERYGVIANIEYAPSDWTKLFFRPSFTRYEEAENRPEWSIQADGDRIPTSPTTGTFTESETIRESSNELTERQMIAVATGGEHRFGASGQFLLEGQLTYSSAKEEDPLAKAYEFFDPAEPPGTWDSSNFLYVNSVGPRRFDANSYILDELTREHALQEADLLVPSLDLRWDHKLGDYFGYLQVGFQANIRDRFVDDTSLRYNDGGTPLSLAGVARPMPDVLTYRSGPTPDQQAIDELFLSDPDRFELDIPRTEANSAEDDYEIEERIYAGYLMASYDLGDDLTVLGGVRVERTEVVLDAKQALELNGDFAGVTPVHGEHGFTDVFPNIQARYAATDNLILRAAYSATIGRPDFIDLAPITGLEVDIINPTDPASLYNGQVEIGNPELQPYLADNFDLTAEYYTESHGLFAVGVFYKQIDNPIFVRELEVNNVTRFGYTFEELEIQTVENAEEGEITGVELIAQQQLAFLPGWWRGFGFAVNATFVDSSVTVFDREDELPFFTQSDSIYGAQLFYELGRIEARLAYQYRDAFLEELGGGPEEDMWRGERESLDLKVSVGILEDTSIFFSGQNLTEDPFIRYQGVPSLQRLGGAGDEGYEIYGTTYLLGISTNFFGE